MPGIRFREKVAREEIFLAAFNALKEEGAVIIRGGKELSIPILVEGEVVFVGIELKAKRQFRSGIAYTPDAAAMKVAQNELERKMFKGKPRVKKEGKAKTLKEYCEATERAIAV